MNRWTNDENLHRCTCGCDPAWDDVIDSGSGSHFVQCLKCKRRYPTNTAWINWSLGIWIEDEHHVGSAWTQKPDSSFDISDLTWER